MSKEEIDGILDLFKWLGAIMTAQLILFYMTTKPSLSILWKTTLYMLFGLISVIAFMVFFIKSRDPGFSGLLFLLLLALAYFVADKLDQI